MKFLAFTDLHEDKEMLSELVKRAAKQDIDFIVCCGDISTFGNGLQYNFKKLNSLGKKVYVLPGNHEEGPEFAGIVAKYPNLVNLDRSAKIEGQVLTEGYLWGKETQGNFDVTLQEGEYFVMGDNRGFSFDSRSWGSLAREDITGLARFRLWPIHEVMAFSAPRY